jgi:hypothetical protein
MEAGKSTLVPRDLVRPKAYEIDGIDGIDKKYEKYLEPLHLTNSWL